MQKDELQRLVSEKNKEIARLKEERDQAVYQYVAERFSNNDVVRDLKTGKLYGITLTRVMDTHCWETAYVVGYPITKSGRKALIGYVNLNVDELEFVRKGIED